eukprot:Seg1546.11 transcript_id=Seg1546.11/GoldUCD/mRNA.D3Y31 product="hypothetical protein" protein_id=Seg1546.11/GoldUCD/D3Y31
MDDKAYLCPNTSTGVQSLRSQTLFQVNDENLARKLPKYDFPVTLVNCTPGTFLFMNKVSEIVNDKETIKTVDQQSVVVTKPKAFIGSSGTIWASNTMQIKHAEPSLYESEKHLPWQSKAYRSILLFVQDNLHYFLDQLVESDMLLVSGKPECIFRKYEMEKLQKLKNRILAVKERFMGNQGKFCEMETQILKSLSDELDNVSVKIDEISLHLVSGLAGADITVRDVADNILSCLVIIKDRSQIPKLKSRIIDLTDAGPGVGITNREVRFRTIQEVRIAQYDYYIRHHLAPGDSSQNEVERIQSYVGDAICDGAGINWEFQSREESLKDIDVQTITTEELEQIELERMKFNAYKVSNEVSQRIDGAVAPDGYLKSFVTNDEKSLFFWDQHHLKQFTERKQDEIVPGHNYYLKVENFMELHVRSGEKYFEFIKYSCQNGDASCDFCESFGWTDVPCRRVPEPMPDYEAPDFKYLHVKETPSETGGNLRKVDDFNPRVQLKKMFEDEVIGSDDQVKIGGFSQEYIVDEAIVMAFLKELSLQHTLKQKRKAEQKDKRSNEMEMEYKDINWIDYVDRGCLKMLLVKTLDKYLIHNNMRGVLKLKKKDKVLAISLHVQNQRFELGQTIQNEKEVVNDEEFISDDDQDEVINYLSDATESSCDGSAGEMEIDGETPNEDIAEDDNCDDLFRPTRSGRLAGGWRLASFIAPKVNVFARSSNKELTAPLGVESVVLADVFSSLGFVLEHGYRDNVDSPERQILCMPCARSLVTVKVKFSKLTRNLTCQGKENNAESDVSRLSPPTSRSKRFLDPGHHSGLSPAAKQVKQPLSTHSTTNKNANPRKLAFDELHIEKPKSSTVQAVISYADGSIKRLTTEGKSSTMIRCLAYKNHTGFSKAAMSVPSLKEAIVGSVCKILQKEVSIYKKGENLLEVKKNTKPSEISDFKLSEFWAELNQKMPVTMTLLESLTSKEYTDVDKWWLQVLGCWKDARARAVDVTQGSNQNADPNDEES